MKEKNIINLTQGGAKLSLLLFICDVILIKTWSNEIIHNSLKTQFRENLFSLNGKHNLCLEYNLFKLYS